MKVSPEGPVIETVAGRRRRAYGWPSLWLVAAFFVGGLFAAHGLCDGIAIGGQDNSGQMKDVQNLLTTIQSIGMKWVAKVIGGFLVITGFWKIAVRDFMSGILATGGGGSLFFVEKIADSLSRMSGG